MYRWSREIPPSTGTGSAPAGSEMGNCRVLLSWNQAIGIGKAPRSFPRGYSPVAGTGKEKFEASVNWLFLRIKWSRLRYSFRSRLVLSSIKLASNKANDSKKCVTIGFVNTADGIYAYINGKTSDATVFLPTGKQIGEIFHAGLTRWFMSCRSWIRQKSHLWSTSPIIRKI